MLRRLLVVLVAMSLAVAACGGDDDDPVVGGDTTTSSVPETVDDEDDEEAAETGAEGDVQIAETSLGSVLVDAEGFTLYLFTNDSEGSSSCTGGCATTWPPLVVDRNPTAGLGVEESRLGTIERDDGSMQLTYNGHPLYRYAADEAPGDVNGQGVGGVWFAVTADGDAVEAAAPSIDY